MTSEALHSFPFAENGNAGQSIHRTKAAVREMAGFHDLPEADPLIITCQEYEMVLGSLARASASFAAAAKIQTFSRAMTLFGDSTPSPDQLIKTVFAHRDFGRTKGKILQDAHAMDMVDRAINSDTDIVRLYCTGFPMKVFNPLETNYQGDSVDLGDASVLLRFAELSEVLSHFGDQIGKHFAVEIVSDGQMNSGMFKVDSKVTDSYVHNLNALTGYLGISSFVSVREFFALMSSNDYRKVEFDSVSEIMKGEFHGKFDRLLIEGNLSQSIASAQELEQNEYGGSSFGDIFNSTVGSVRYEGIEQLCDTYGLNFTVIYAMILESILWDQDIAQSENCASFLASLPVESHEYILEVLRQERTRTMKTAWHSTVEYLAVLKANKHTGILDSLYPDGIRMTTRPKAGQIGVHTSDQNCPSLFSYHSVPAVIPCNKGRNVKIDFQLRSHVLRNGFQPIAQEGSDIQFYLHPDIPVQMTANLPWMRGSVRIQQPAV